MKKSGRSAITRVDYSKLREMTCMYSIFRDLAIIILSAKFLAWLPASARPRRWSVKFSPVC